MNNNPLTSWFQRNRWGIVIAVYRGYVLFFLFLERGIGLAASASFIVFPVIASAWFYGTGVGLLAVVISLILNILLFNLVGEPGWNAAFMHGGLAGTVALTLLAIITGK